MHNTPTKRSKPSQAIPFVLFGITESKRLTELRVGSITHGFYLSRKIAYPPLAPVIAKQPGHRNDPRILGWEHNHTKHVYRPNRSWGQPQRGNGTPAFV